jgi:peroxiredoxin
MAVPASPGQQKMAKPPASHLPAPGSVASDFEMNGIDGQPVRLSSHRGKVILLEFTATWCPPCRQAVRDIKQLRSRAATPSDLVVISISLDGGENTDTTREDVVRFVREEQVDWPMLFDDTGMENSVARSYGVEVLPAYILCPPTS